MTEPDPLRLSVAATMYQSEAYLAEFCARAGRAAAALAGDAYEIVLVNDGSPDGSLAEALRLQRTDPHIRIVDLSRNFGHHKAMMTALEHCRGARVFLIDCDLEEPPEALEKLAAALEAGPGADVAFGVQTAARKGPWFSRWTGRLYYHIFNRLSRHRIAEDQLTARLMTRRYVTALLRHREHHFNIEGLWHITGFRQVPVQVAKTGYKGVSSYSLQKKIAYFVNAITAFSNLPLVYIAILGLVLTTASSAAVVVLVALYFLFGTTVAGWTSVMVSLWFLSGLIILMLGIVSIYLSIMFAEVKARPYTIVRDIYEPGDAGPEGGEDD